MQKIVINNCFGGFGLSEEAFKWLIKNKGWRTTKYNKEGNHEDDTAEIVDLTSGKYYSSIMGKYGFTNDPERDNKDLVEVVEVLGTERASDRFAELKIIEVPNDVEWEIEEYDGNEWVSEKHRTWH